MTKTNPSSFSAVVPVWSAWLALGLGAAGAAVALAPSSATPLVAPAPPATAAHAAAAAPQAIAVEPAVTAPAAPAPASPGATASADFVVTIEGVAYLRLTDLDPELALPKHGALRLIDGDSAAYSLGEVAASDAPAPFGAWAGEQVIADERCAATVRGFAVISQLVGSPEYADSGLSWNADTVMAYGHPFFAARLDGCAGSALGRAAAAPATLRPIAVRDRRLAAAAEALLFASPAARAADQELAEFDTGSSWRAQAKTTTRVVKHPKTGVTWVVVFASNDGRDCGTPTMNLLGVFQVGAGGALLPSEVRNLEELHQLDAVIDVDGDGAFEILGRPWLGFDRFLMDPTGKVLERLELPFYGCPC